MKVLVLGSNGQLGQSFKAYKSLSNFNYLFANKNFIDLIKSKNMFKKFDLIRPDIIINCAAYTNVDRSENYKDLAFKINFESVKKISKWCYENNVFLIHFSTDYVFDGSKKEPYFESDKPNPISIYGKSKFLGEEELLNSPVKGTCLRTSWVHSTYGKNFFLTIKSLLEQKQTISIVDDQFGIPTTTNFLVKVTEEIMKLKCKNKEVPKILHAVPSNSPKNISWYKFGEIIHKNLKKFDQKNTLKCNQILKINSSSYPQVAERPKFSVLSNKKLSKIINLKLNNWLIEHEKIYSGL